MIKIAPSILAADHACMGKAISSLVEWNADWIHFDVMDGNFVPNITFGPTMLKAIRPYSDLFVDVHLMVADPERWIYPFKEAGADLITFHIEAVTDPVPLLNKIHMLGIKNGLVLCPETPADAVIPYLHICDLVLPMTVRPGFGGQKFHPEILEKIKQLKSVIDNNGYPCEIEVDGGINEENAPLCIQAGASVLVACSSVFGSSDPKRTISNLRG